MDAQTIQTLVSSLGFPIIMCGALFWFINKTIKDFTESVRNSLDDLSKAISDNTSATTRLVTTVEILSKMGGEDNG